MWKGEFENYLKEKYRNELTRAAYFSDVKLYARWFLSYAEEEFHPGLLTSMDMRAWREYSLNVERVLPATWNRRMASLQVFSTWALIAEYVIEDPFRGIDAAIMLKAPIKWLEDNDFHRICRKLENDVNSARSDVKRKQAIRNRAIVALMVFAGLRDGEVVNVWREDLLLTDRTGAVRVRNGKGGTYTDQDGVDIHYEGTIWIKAWLKIRGDVSGPLFGGITTRQIQRFVHDLGLDCGIDDLTPHRFRHTYVHFMRKGKFRRDGQPVELHVVQQAARHKRIATTARYDMPSRQELREAVGA